MYISSYKLDLIHICVYVYKSMHAFVMHIYVYTHTSTICLSLIKLLTHFSTLWNRVQGSKQKKLDYELLYRTTDLVSAGRKDRSTSCRISPVQSLSHI